MADKEFMLENGKFKWCMRDNIEGNTFKYDTEENMFIWFTMKDGKYQVCFNGNKVSILIVSDIGWGYYDPLYCMTLDGSTFKYGYDDTVEYFDDHLIVNGRYLYRSTIEDLETGKIKFNYSEEHKICKKILDIINRKIIFEDNHLIINGEKIKWWD